MKTVPSDGSKGLRVIVCCAFDHRADNREIEALKRRVLACEHVLHAIEVSGSYDFMIEAVVPDLATYNAKRKAYADALTRLVSRYEASFVCQRFVRDIHEAEGLWIRDSDGMRKVNLRRIDKVTSEGDYVRIHTNGQSHLMHATMASFLERLPSGEFIQVHRSMIVRCQFVERLSHKANRWVALLADGTEQRISKTNLAGVLRCLRDSLPMDGATSSKVVPFTEKPVTRSESRVN